MMNFDDGNELQIEGVDTALSVDVDASSRVHSSSIVIESNSDIKDNFTEVNDIIITPEECHLKRGLYQHHYDEHIQRGFLREHLVEMVESGWVTSFTITSGSATNKLPLFPTKLWDKEIGDVVLYSYSHDFSQIKIDKVINDKRGRRIKYLSPPGVSSKAWFPEGFAEASVRVVTEGAIDAALGTLLGGIPTAGIAGVSHFLKAIGIGVRLVILFDADGRLNPSVIAALYIAGKLSNNNIQTIPPIDGQPKAGLEEYFKAGYTPEDYRALIATAKTPLGFLYDIFSGELPQDERKLKLVKRACLLAARHEDKDDAFALLHEACKRAKLSADIKASIRARMEKVIAKRDKKNQPLINEVIEVSEAAKTFVNSGKLPELLRKLIKQTGIIKIHEFTLFDTIVSSGILDHRESRGLNVLYTGRRGGGKSASQKIKSMLLPPNNVHFTIDVTMPAFKRGGDSFKCKQIVIDELSPISDDIVVSSD